MRNQGRTAVTECFRGLTRLALLAAIGALGWVSVAAAQSDPAASLTVKDYITGGPGAVLGQLAKLKSVAAAGKGKIAVLLPDTRSSARWATEDAPGFARAFQAMGLSASDYIITNAQGSPATQQTQAEQAITQGASVILIANLDSGSAAAIEANAKAQGVVSLDYDRLTLKGSAAYYISFDGEAVGRLLGAGLVDGIKALKVAKPDIYELGGSPTDNNGTLFENGYDSVLNPLYASKAATLVTRVRVPNWDNQVGETMFQQAYQAHPQINAVLAANDGMAQSAIAVLKNEKIPPNTVPITGQDATLQGVQNILAGYQYMTVYKPIYEQVAAAATVAVFARARQAPPAGLLNAEADAQGHKVPSVLLSAVSVTKDNMQATVIDDKFIDPKQLCSGEFAAICARTGIH
jgi:D-xylose transport system substrate-binding protein